MTKFIKHGVNYINPESIAYVRYDKHNDKAFIKFLGEPGPATSVANGMGLLKKLGLVRLDETAEPRPNVVNLSADDYPTKSLPATEPEPEDIPEGAGEELPNEAFDDFLASTKE